MFDMDPKTRISIKQVLDRLQKKLHSVNVARRQEKRRKKSKAKAVETSLKSLDSNRSEETQNRLMVLEWYCVDEEETKVIVVEIKDEKLE